MSSLTEVPADTSAQPARGGALRGPAPWRRGVPDTLLGLYRRYCEVETRELLAILPPAGLRSLYREARNRAEAGGVAISADPIGAVRALAGEILPLPPYAEWVGLYLQNRTEYLRRMGVSELPERDEPVTVELRPFGEGWFAALSVLRTPLEWRGYLEFHREEGAGAGPCWRTTDIFRESTPSGIRARFKALTPASLEAFLRSVLP